MAIQHPYLLFLGDAPDQLAAKTAQGIAHWRPDWCVGQLSLEGCKADLGLPEMTLEAAREAGAKTLVIGVANRGGVFSESWITVLEQALLLGFDLAAGLHNRLADVPVLKAAAEQHGRQLFDVRHPDRDFEVASGKKRSGRRILAVGTDCSVGKMYTALALEKEMKARDMKVDFRATGQTGILIAGSGVSIDAVVADFISGAVEYLSPANDVDHWDIVEGQGSLFHASFAGVSMGLLHGAQPDALILCHEPTRPHMRGLPDYPLPTLSACIDANLAAARLTNPKVHFIGIAVNTSQMHDSAIEAYLRRLEDEFELPTVDPFREGVKPLVDRLQ
ncbi:N-acetyltransferase DgcN [Pelagibius sp.]|uniref:N-acetyltransferase DgcN n=1 Tax=Pelagibius sp. TaxID=1931238 RepID=UPI0026271878|nr:N-acetyltransferase DgcN [Pelagibius sp.]